MDAMAASTDGFVLAEKDLEIRGAGEVFGERQSGFSDLKLGRIPRDEAIVLEARRVAEEILDDDPDLARHVAAARGGRRPPRRRRRVPLQVMRTLMACVDIRVIAGERRGPPARRARRRRVRPTKDMVREAMFSALDARDALVDARGARPLRRQRRARDRSAVARRASARCSSSATGAALERDPHEPRRRSGFGDRRHGRRPSTWRRSSAARRRRAPFDLVFVDPPYDTDDEDRRRALLAALAARVARRRRDRRASNGRCGIRVDRRRPGCRTGWERTFGDTLLIVPVD